MVPGCVGFSTPTGQGLLITNQLSPIQIVRENIVPKETMKIGKALCTNWFGLVSTGNCSIRAAAKDMGISKVYYVDKQVKSLLFIYSCQTTIVYGE